MTIYLAVIAVIVVFDIVSEDTRSDASLRRLLLIVALTVLGAISGMRSEEVGVDTQKYLSVFQEIAALGPDRGYAYGEFGFRQLCYFLSLAGFGPQALLIVCGAVLSISLYFFITRFVESKYWLLAVFIFVCGTYYFASMNIMRQYLAMAIGMAAVLAWARGRKLLAFVVLLLASSVHVSALVLLSLPFLVLVLRRTHVRFVTILLYAGGVAILIAGVSNVASAVLVNIPRWDQYANSYWLEGRNAAAALKLVLPNLLVVLHLSWEARQRRLVKSGALHGTRGPSDQGDPLHDQIITAGALIYVAALTSVFGIVTLTRLSEYFAPFLIAFACRLLSRLEKNARVALWLVIVAYYLLLTTGSVIWQDSNAVVPYGFAR